MTHLTPANDNKVKISHTTTSVRHYTDTVVPEEDSSTSQVSHSGDAVQVDISSVFNMCDERFTSGFFWIVLELYSSTIYDVFFLNQNIPRFTQLLVDSRLLLHHCACAKSGRFYQQDDGM